MAKLSQKEFMEKVKTVLGDRDDDEALSFLEDCKDTISSEDDSWKEKYDTVVKEKEELDKQWRTKYKERFYSSDDSHTDKDDNIDTKKKPSQTSTTEPEDDDKLEQAEKVRFDDLFTKGE